MRSLRARVCAYNLVMGGLFVALIVHGEASANSKALMGNTVQLLDVLKKPQDPSKIDTIVADLTNSLVKAQTSSDLVKLSSSVDGSVVARAVCAAAMDVKSKDAANKADKKDKANEAAKACDNMFSDDYVSSILAGSDKTGHMNSGQYDASVAKLIGVNDGDTSAASAFLQSLLPASHGAGDDLHGLLSLDAANPSSALDGISKMLEHGGVAGLGAGEAIAELPEAKNQPKYVDESKIQSTGESLVPNGRSVATSQAGGGGGLSSGVVSRGLSSQPASGLSPGETFVGPNTNSLPIRTPASSDVWTLGVTSPTTGSSSASSGHGLSDVTGDSGLSLPMVNNPLVTMGGAKSTADASTKPQKSGELTIGNTDTAPKSVSDIEKKYGISNTGVPAIDNGISNQLASRSLADQAASHTSFTNNILNNNFNLGDLGGGAQPSSVIQNIVQQPAAPGVVAPPVANTFGAQLPAGVAATNGAQSMLPTGAVAAAVHGAHAGLQSVSGSVSAAFSKESSLGDRPTRFTNKEVVLEHVFSGCQVSPEKMNEINLFVKSQQCESVIEQMQKVSNAKRCSISGYNLPGVSTEEQLRCAVVNLTAADFACNKNIQDFGIVQKRMYIGNQVRMISALQHVMPSSSEVIPEAPSSGKIELAYSMACNRTWKTSKEDAKDLCAPSKLNVASWTIFGEMMNIIEKHNTKVQKNQKDSKALQGFLGKPLGELSSTGCSPVDFVKTAHVWISEYLCRLRTKNKCQSGTVIDAAMPTQDPGDTYLGDDLASVDNSFDGMMICLKDGCHKLGLGDPSLPENSYPNHFHMGMFDENHDQQKTNGDVKKPSSKINLD